MESTTRSVGDGAALSMLQKILQELQAIREELRQLREEVRQKPKPE